MKKVIALLLMAAMLSVSLCSCAVDMTDMGSIIPMYLATAQKNLDPTRMIYDKDFTKFSGLMFDGLTEVTSNGKINMLLAESYKEEYDEERGEYYLYINLSETRWNDGRTFSADHVVYAWKKVLSPESDSPAASLLYDVKNAKAVKSGLMSIDDLGVAAVDLQTLEVQFEKPIDPELFLEAISSPSLVPLRDDAITKKEDTWATNTNDFTTNGKFTVKQFDTSGEYRIEFSKYYRLTPEVEKGYNQFVKPYQLITDYSEIQTPEQAIEQFNNGEIYYVGAFNSATYEANKDQIKSSPTLSSFTYFFDCENSVLKEAAVRKALSLSLDRNTIAGLIGQGSQAAEGFVSSISTGSTMKKSFRKEAGSVYSTSADLSAAQGLLNQANVHSGSFTITYRNDRDYDVKVAEYAKSVWESLGFHVTLKGLDLQNYEKALYNKDFDVIGLDYFALSTNPYAALAQFAPSYSGSAVSVDVNSSEISTHVTNYQSDAYTALLDSVLAETTRSERNAILIEIEKLLSEDCPAIALAFYSHNYLASPELKGLKTSPYGFTDFTNAVLKNYKEKNAQYQEKAEAEAANQ